MAMTPHSRNRDDDNDDDDDQDFNSDDSFDWSVPNTRKNPTRKGIANKVSAAKSPIKKKAKKPGRKPLEKVIVLPSDPKLKRKAQNRAAQRAFRERKEQFVNELQDQMRELQEAKEKCEKELFAENARLKLENERLNEENYLLKEAKFTFQFSSKKEKVVDKPTPPPPPPPPNAMLLLCPEMDSQSQADESMMSSCGCEDGSKCDCQQSTSDRFMPDTSFIQTSKSAFNVLHGMSDYRVPFNEADTLVQGEPCPALFGAEMDFFGSISSSTTSPTDPVEELDAYFDEQNALLKCAPDNEKPCKKKVLGMLRRARGRNCSITQINQDVKSYCPDFNLDQLCEALKKKITLDPHHTLTADDVDLYIECIQRNA